MSIGVDAAEASTKGMRSIEHLGPTEMELMSCSFLGKLIQWFLSLRPTSAVNLSAEKIAEAGRLLTTEPVLCRLEIDPGLKYTRRLIDAFDEGRAGKLARTFAAHETWQTPTLIRLKAEQLGDDPLFTNDPNLRYMPASDRQYWASLARQFSARVPPSARETLSKELALEFRMTKLFDENGVPMLAGSDGGIWLVPGFTLHQEFDLLAQAGLSPLKLLQMTTLNGARFLSREGSMGSVAEGKDANLVLLDGNPIESVRNLHRIRAVVRAGRYYSHEELEGLKKEVADHISSAGSTSSPRPFAP